MRIHSPVIFVPICICFILSFSSIISSPGKLPPINVAPQESLLLGYMPHRDDFEDFDKSIEGLVSQIGDKSVEDEDVDIALKLGESSRFTTFPKSVFIMTNYVVLAPSVFAEYKIFNSFPASLLFLFLLHSDSGSGLLCYKMNKISLVE